MTTTVVKIEGKGLLWARVFGNVGSAGGILFVPKWSKGGGDYLNKGW